MSKISKAVASETRANNEAKVLRRDEVVTNFMGGDSYTVNPLTRLKLITSSCIFGEPQYYRGCGMKSKSMDMSKDARSIISANDILFYASDNSDESTVDYMEKAIDNALDYDFLGTLRWAVELRSDYLIRLNPQVIMVRAALHPKRKEFTNEYPALFGILNSKVMSRADESMSQLSYYLYKKGHKGDIPSLLKRSWSKHLSSLTAYAVAKYKNHEIGMINAVRICHANSSVLNELMQTGRVQVDESEQTWENLRSAGMSWKEIFDTVNMGHMALLRNASGFFREVTDIDYRKRYLDKLVSGVKTGKQLPFRYYAAYKAVDESDTIHDKGMLLDCLEECIDVAICNMPKLKGRTMVLTDNSGSAWGSFTSSYGRMTVAEINNLSAVLTAKCSDVGYVGKFGSKLKVYEISKQKGALAQAKEISASRGNDVGSSTEGGIWEFFDKAMQNKEHWDNIFIYSDQQAGTGRLYGTGEQSFKYQRRGYGIGNAFINVFQLILDYRRNVHDKVNVFSVQTAGYSNMVIPVYAYIQEISLCVYKTIVKIFPKFSHNSFP